jgi:hypothetical protein
MSTDSQLPGTVSQFIIRHLDSVAELEALLLAQSTPDEAWTVAALASRLYIKDAEAVAVLEALHRRGFLRHDGDAYRYAPASEHLRVGAEALATAYPRFLIPITSLIHGKPRSALRDFADAFRWREEK